MPPARLVQGPASRQLRALEDLGPCQCLTDGGGEGVGGGGGKPGVRVVGMGEERDRRREREGNTLIYSSPWTEVACRNSFFYKKGILWG